MKTYTYSNTKGEQVTVNAAIVLNASGKYVAEVTAIHNGTTYRNYTTEIHPAHKAAGLVAKIDKIGINAIHGKAIADMIEAVKAESAEYQQQQAKRDKIDAEASEYYQHVDRMASAMRD